MAVAVLPGVTAVRGVAGVGAGAPEPACAKVAVELVTEKSVPLYAGVVNRPELSPPWAWEQGTEPMDTRAANKNPPNVFINPFRQVGILFFTPSCTS